MGSHVSPPPSTSREEKAREEGRALVYGTVEKDEFSGWEETFEAKYPFIEVDYRREYVYGSPQPMAEKIVREIKDGKETADAVIASVSPMIQMREMDLLRRAALPEASAYPTKIRQADWYWFPIVQIYNPKAVPKEDLPALSLDLTNPRWRESIAVHNVTLGTLGSYWLASLSHRGDPPIRGAVRAGGWVGGFMQTIAVVKWYAPTQKPEFRLEARLSYLKHRKPSR